MSPRYAWLWLAILAAGCRGEYHWAYQYDPHPGLIVIALNEQEPGEAVHVYATIVGVRSQDAEAAPASIEVRFRIENRTPHTAMISAESLQLLTADLQALPPRGFSPEPPTNIPAGQTQQFTAYFGDDTRPIRDQQLLQSLSLRMEIEVAGKRSLQILRFDRRPTSRPYYRDRLREPWERDEPGVHFGVGVGT